jgi:serine/threonine-protein kinase RsbW
MRPPNRGAAEGQLRLHIPARMDCIGLLGTAVRAVSLQAGLTLERSEQMELAVIEAITNIIRHGVPHQPDSAIDVHVIAFEHLLEYQIADQGQPIPATLLEPPDRDVFNYDNMQLDELPEGGLGMALIRSIADEMEYHSGAEGNLMTLRRYRESPDYDRI